MAEAPLARGIERYLIPVFRSAGFTRHRDLCAWRDLDGGQVVHVLHVTAGALETLAGDAAPIRFEIQVGVFAAFVPAMFHPCPLGPEGAPQPRHWHCDMRAGLLTAGAEGREQTPPTDTVPRAPGVGRQAEGVLADAAEGIAKLALPWLEAFRSVKDFTGFDVRTPPVPVRARRLGANLLRWEQGAGDLRLAAGYAALAFGERARAFEILSDVMDDLQRARALWASVDASARGNHWQAVDIYHRMRAKVLQRDLDGLVFGRA